MVRVKAPFPTDALNFIQSAGQTMTPRAVGARANEVLPPSAKTARAAPPKAKKEKTIPPESKPEALPWDGVDPKLKIYFQLRMPVVTREKIGFILDHMVGRKWSGVQAFVMEALDAAVAAELERIKKEKGAGR